MISTSTSGGTDVYRNANRAERRYGTIAAWFRSFGAKRLVDLGIGTGRLAKLLMPEFEVVGVDIAKNCLDEGVDVPLVVAPIWSDLDIGTFDGVICTDVLEHLPIEYVDKAISNIGRLAPHGYITIGLTQEGIRFPGLPLHLTIESVAWWDDRIPFSLVDKALHGGGIARY